MKPLPDPLKQLIEAKSSANVATLLHDGSPHITQTWVDHEGDLFLLNIFEGSQKHRNVAGIPKFAIDVCDPTNAFNVAVIRGRVSQVTFDSTEEHVDKLAKNTQRRTKIPCAGRG